MGYYDEAFGSFVNPWIPPSSGTPIYLAEDAWLTTVLSRKQAGQIGSAVIGSLLTRPPTAVPVVLDVKELVSTHLAIIASTGAGKSYLASVIIEEMMRPYNRAAVLIVDPHGEYSTLQEIANGEEFRESEPASPAARHQPRYEARTRVYLHDQVKVRMNTLTLGDLRYLLPNMTDKQHHFLSRAFEALQKEKKSQPWARRRPEAPREQRWAYAPTTIAATIAAIAPSPRCTGRSTSGSAITRWSSTQFHTSIWARCFSRANAPCSNSTRSTSATSR